MGRTRRFYDQVDFLVNDRAAFIFEIESRDDSLDKRGFINLALNNYQSNLFHRVALAAA